MIKYSFKKSLSILILMLLLFLPLTLNSFSLSTIKAKIFLGESYSGKGYTLREGHYKVRGNIVFKSIKIRSDYTVTLFANTDYSGESYSLNGFVPSIPDLNFKVSSLIVSKKINSTPILEDWKGENCKVSSINKSVFLYATLKKDTLYNQNGDNGAIKLNSIFYEDRNLPAKSYYYDGIKSIYYDGNSINIEMKSSTLSYGVEIHAEDKTTNNCIYRIGTSFRDGKLIIGNNSKYPDLLTPGLIRVVYGEHHFLFRLT